MFLIVFDLREEISNQSRIEYWLLSIRMHVGQDVPIFLIGTHADDKQFRDDEEKLGKILNKIAEEFTPKFQGIRLITAVSTYDGSGIDELKENLIVEALKQKHMGKIVPKPYFLLEESIQSIKDDKRKIQETPIITWEQYTQIAGNCHIHNDVSLISATSFLHDLGVLLYFNNDHTISTLLANVVIIDPQWLIDMMVFSLSLSSFLLSLFPSFPFSIPPLSFLLFLLHSSFIFFPLSFSIPPLSFLLFLPFPVSPSFPSFPLLPFLAFPFSSGLSSSPFSHSFYSTSFPFALPLLLVLVFPPALCASLPLPLFPSPLIYKLPSRSFLTPSPLSPSPSVPLFY